MISGVMSSCFAFGLAAGAPIRELTQQHGVALLVASTAVMGVGNASV
jgi:hypothetical protein